MIIDVDHMSNKSLDRTVRLAALRSYPLVASHVQFFDLNEQGIRHERMRTRNQLQQIKDSGGMIAAMLKDDVQDTDRIGQKWSKPYGSVADDCIHSTKLFAHMVEYAVDEIGLDVAFGSDFNGVAGHIGPRFGSDACGRHGDDPSSGKLSYPLSSMSSANSTSKPRDSAPLISTWMVWPMWACCRTWSPT